MISIQLDEYVSKISEQFLKISFIYFIVKCNVNFINILHFAFGKMTQAVTILYIVTIS